MRAGQSPVTRVAGEVDDLVKALGCDTGISKAVGALLCEVNDELVVDLRRYMAEATLADLIDREEDRLPSIPAVSA